MLVVTAVLPVFCRVSVCVADAVPNDCVPKLVVLDVVNVNVPGGV